MRLNRIFTALACIFLLAGISAAVELFGGNEVLVANGAGGATGGPFLILDTNNLELGVDAHAWVAEGEDEGEIGNASAAFNGSGSVSIFRDLENDGDNDGTGVIQAVYYNGRVQAMANKTVANPGTIDASSEVYASSQAYGDDDEDAEVYGDAGIHSAIDGFDATGTAAAVARGTAGYRTEFINKTAPVLSTSIKATGELSGETYMTAENKRNIGESVTYGRANMYTQSIAAQDSSSSYSVLNANFDAGSAAKNSANTISGFVNATKAASYAWDSNRTSSMPSSTNYNAYTNVAGVLLGGAKAFEEGDEVDVSAYLSASSSHGVTAFNAHSHADTQTYARKLGDNNRTHRVEGSVFINNAAADSITQGRLGTKALKAESSFKTLGSTTGSGAGDNIGAGIFLSNLTDEDGVGTAGSYDQDANWDNSAEVFGLTTDFKVVNSGMDFSTDALDTGAIGTVMTIMNNAKPLLNATYGTRVNSTNMANQKNWNWYASTNGVLNQGGVIDVPTFATTGTTPVDTQSYVGRTYTREFQTSNPT
jgi:hypothetical protein